jgi:hypothetical protein
VSVRAVCESLGIDNATQQAKLKTKESAVVGHIPTTASDGKTYSHFMISLTSLPKWLSEIETSRVGELARPKLIRYQKRTVTR